MTENSRPPQLDIDEKWDRVLDVGLRRFVYGTLSGGVLGLVFLRGGISRAAVTGIGAGFGLGSAYSDTQKELHQIWNRSASAAAP